MRILFCDRDATDWFTPSWSKVYLNLARALGEIGHEVWALTPLNRYSLELWEDQVNFVKHLGDAKGKFDVIQSYSFLDGERVITLSEKFGGKPFQWVWNDVLLDWKSLAYMIFYEWSIAWKNPKRSISCFKGVVPSALKRIYLSRKRFSDIVVPTSYLANQLTRCGIRYDKIHVIPLGVDSRLFSPSVKKGDVPTKFRRVFLKYKTILFLGGYSQFRGIKKLIKAFRIIENRIENVKLILGLMYSNVSCKGCIVTGYRKDLHNFISLSDVIVLPYRNTFNMTSIPLTLIEAMSCGKPIVSTKIGPIPEVIRSYEDGILVDYDEVSIANSIIELLENESLRKRLGEKAREKIIKKYDWRIIAERFTELYGEKIGKSH